MRIIYDHEVFTKQRYGGVSRYFFEIISRISKFEDAEVSIFLGLNDTGYNFNEIRESLKDFDSFKVSNIHKIHILFNWLNKRLFERTLYKTAAGLLHKTYYSSAGLEYAGAKIITVHDMTHEIYPSFFSEGDSHSSMKRKCAEKADGIICVSKTTQQDLIDIFKIPEEKTCVIHHGNSLRIKATGKRIIGEPYILFVGQRWGYKNFNMLLTAYAICKRFNENFKLVCFGGDNPNRAEQLYIYDKNLEQKVIFTRGSDSRLANLYKYASTLVYPSYYEGFGFPPLEAMYYGCPVIASNTSSIPEVVADSGLYFNPYQIEDLIHKLDIILTDTQYKNEIVKKGFDREKVFTWDKCAAETFNFYRKIKI